MQLTKLNAISPLDGRYRNKVSELAEYFSEEALIKYRLIVEIEYFIALAQIDHPQLPKLSASQKQLLQAIASNFSSEDAARIKGIERVTNHDVKAVEYFIKEAIDKTGNQGLIEDKEFVHFGLTSQDINNTSTPMMLRDALQKVYFPQLAEILTILQNFADEWQHLPMLARTHGQPASPTTLGKEIRVFAVRLHNQFQQLKALPYPAKFGGATGNLNAHYIAFPEVDWDAFANQFVTQTLGLSRSVPTTQIEHYDGLGQIFDNIKRINTIVIDLCQDIWIYISMEYFKQKVRKNEVGSSAMPHKVNPIDFENAEGNAGISIALLEFLSRKLPVSRLQRDLTDSTILRNLGVAVGHALLALLSLKKGLGKLLVNEEWIIKDLNQNWQVLAEAIQNVLRREKYPNPYETLKAFTRGKGELNEKTLKAFIEQLSIDEEIKASLKNLTPTTYIGNANRT